MRKGYSLIEIIIVVTIVLTLLGGGMLSYSRYNAQRTAIRDAGVFADVLSQARERTISRDLDDSTNCTSFIGYRVEVIPASSSFALYRLCTGVTIPAISTYQLRDSTILGSNTVRIDFQYPYGTLVGSAQSVSFRSKTTSACQRVLINTAGVISEQSC